jgi:phosphoserine phosphatase RsbX
MIVEWAVAERPLPGQHVSGDAYIVEPFADGTLLAVIDALGHGEDACATSALAVATLREHARKPISALIRLCHERLRGERGVVLSAAWVDTTRDVVTWGGIGNVEGCLRRADLNSLRPRESLVLRNGVVGFQLRDVRADVLPIAPRDVLIFATDGISTNFIDDSDVGTPQQIADRILIKYGKPSDDALVLVARYIGAGL